MINLKMAMAIGFCVAACVRGAKAEESAYTAKIITASGSSIIDWNNAKNWENGHVPNGTAAAWIGAPGNPSPAFEKRFAVTGTVVRAELRICGLGFYEASVNGRRVGEAVLEPAPSVYDRRVYFRTYPVTVTNGENVITVLLGHGLYDCRSESDWENTLERWRGRPRVKAELRLFRPDGSCETVATDATWRQIPNPVASDDFREGELIDPGLVFPRKGMKEFAVVLPAPGGVECEADFPPSTVRRRFRPASIRSLGGNGWMVDAGQDMSGWIRLRIRGANRGDVIAVRYDERIKPDGSPADPTPRKGEPKVEHPRKIDCYVRSAPSDAVLPGGAFQMDRFVATGATEDVYEPRFTYNGFRYVWIRGLKGELRPDDVEVCEVQVDFPTVGSFVCSNGDFNRLMAMTERSYRSNYAMGVPTDCPQREKNGWCGDAMLASEYAQYMFENTAAYGKWMRDFVDSQRADGAVPGIAPTSRWGYVAPWAKRGYGPHACGVLAYIPWMLHAYRDDDSSWATVYEALIRYRDYVRRDIDGKGLVQEGLGDWMCPKSDTSSAYLATAAYYGMLKIMARMAVARGESARAGELEAESVGVRQAFNRAYYRGNGVYDRGQQTAQALALTQGLAEPGERASVRAKLIERVKRDGVRLDYGVFGSKHVLRALSEAGRSDLAYAMLVSPEPPSPLASWLRRGATALWEDWKDGFSRNHIMYGDFSCWAFQYLAGIRLPEGEDSTPAVPNPGVRGFREMLIAPDFIEALDFVTAESRGYRVDWRRTADGIALTVTVPEACRATVRLPGRSDVFVGSGEHHYMF